MVEQRFCKSEKEFCQVVHEWIPLVVSRFSAIRGMPRLACFCSKNHKPYTKPVYNVYNPKPSLSPVARREYREDNRPCGQSFWFLCVIARILSAKWHNDIFPVLRFMKLRSVVGERESGAKSGEKRIAHRSRSATAAAEPQTEARRSSGPGEFAARDERAVCEAERAWSRGRRGRPAARGA